MNWGSCGKGCPSTIGNNTLSAPNSVARQRRPVPALLQHADLAISRAGAGSLSELAVTSTPAILVPFPQAADQHQDANAACAAALGAAVIVHQHAPEHGALTAMLWHLLGPRLRGCAPAADPLVSMGQGMERLAVRDAEQQLAARLVALSA